MLQKFGIPTGVNLIAVAPEQHKFCYLLLRKFQIDIRQLQNVIDIFAGVPVLWNALWFSIVFERRAVAHPLAFYMLDKFAVPGATDFAALLPIDHKLRDRIFHKREADARVFHQYFECIFAWAPLTVHRDFQIAI